MNVGRTLLAKINRKTKEQKNDESTVNLGCNLLQKFIARELKNDDIFANWDTFMEWIRDQKDIETVEVDDDDSENFDDNGRQRNIEGTLNKNNSDENSDGSDYTSSSDDEEETDNYLTDVNGNKIIDEIYQAPNSITFVEQFQIDEYRKDCRRIIVRNYKILYYIKDSEIFVIRVFNTLQNPSKSL